MHSQIAQSRPSASIRGGCRESQMTWFGGPRSRWIWLVVRGWQAEALYRAAEENDYLAVGAAYMITRSATPPESLALGDLLAATGRALTNRAQGERLEP